MILITLILLYIILPFILPYILSLIYDLYIYILEYNNLKGEIISYPYIIEDREKYEWKIEEYKIASKYSFGWCL